MMQQNAPLNLSLFIFTLMSSTRVSAQICTPPISFSTNATGSEILNNPFKPPSGTFSSQGSGDWIWHIATESLPSADQNTSIRQALWLQTTAPEDLLSPNLGYLGCGLIAHGLKHDLVQKGQNDNGTCESVFSQKCITALVGGTAEYATLLAPSQGMTIHDICAEFGTQDRHGVPPDCYDAFDGWGWVEAFPFASPQLSSQPCSSITAGSNQNASRPLWMWGLSTYSPTNMTAYENLTTQVTPLISVLFENHTTDFNTTLGYSEAHLTCLRPSVVQAGSQQPTGVPTSGAMRNYGVVSWGALLVVAGMTVFGCLV